MARVSLGVFLFLDLILSILDYHFSFYNPDNGNCCTNSLFSYKKMGLIRHLCRENSGVWSAGLRLADVKAPVCCQGAEC